MADSTINGLNQIDSVSSSTALPVWDDTNSKTKKATVEQLAVPLTSILSTTFEDKSDLSADVYSAIGIKKHANKTASQGSNATIALTLNKTYLIVARQWNTEQAMSAFLVFHTTGYAVTALAASGTLTYTDSANGFTVKSSSGGVSATAYELDI